MASGFVQFNCCRGVVPGLLWDKWAGVCHMCPLCQETSFGVSPHDPPPKERDCGYEGHFVKIREVIERLRLFESWAQQASIVPSQQLLDARFEKKIVERLQTIEKERILAHFKEEQVFLPLEEYAQCRSTSEGEGLPPISQEAFPAYSSGRDTLSLLVRREKEGKYSVLLELRFCSAARFASCNPRLFFSEVELRPTRRRTYVQFK